MRKETKETSTMKRLYLKYEDGDKELAEDILIGEMDPQWLIDFTREKIVEMEKNGVTFEAILKLYTEFNKVYPEDHFLPIQEVGTHDIDDTDPLANEVSIIWPKERQKTQITTFYIE